MFIGKKGIAMYFFALLGVSFVITLLFLSISNTIYFKDDVLCDSVDIQVSNVCLNKDDFLEFGVVNTGEVPFDFMLNGNSDFFESVSVGKTKKLRVNSVEIGKVSIVPFISKRESVIVCKQKKEEIKVLEVNSEC